MCAVRTSVREPSRAAASSAHRERAPRVAAGLAYDGWWSALCRALTGGASQAGPAAARRTLGQRHFDVQIQGGAGLHLGNIAEMKTGEGKTLVATLPAYLNALTG